MSKKSLIDFIEVKTPCSEDWSKMQGGDKIRFCEHCAFEVNNISEMTRKQAMRLVRASDGRICVRYIKNPVTNKPVFAGKLYQITRRAGLAAGVLGASLTLSSLTYAQEKIGDIKSSNAQIEVSGQTQKDKTDGATASLSGTVTDPNGAVIPYAGITLTSEATDEIFIIQADENGFYEFKTVAAGKYKLSVVGGTELAEKVITGIEVSEGREIRQNVSLGLADQKFEVIIDADSIDFGGMTMGIIMSVQYENPITVAVSDDKIQEVRNLIAKGLSVNAREKNYDNITPLFVAVENGNVEIVELLLSFRARVNALSQSKQTPLMRIDEDATPELVRTLIKYGAKVNLTDADGNTALIFAASYAKSEVLQILIDHGALVNARNKKGQTALMIAAEADNLENVRALILAGADLNLKDEDGETALDLTTDAEIEQLLKNYGAIVEEK